MKQPIMKQPIIQKLLVFLLIFSLFQITNCSKKDGSDEDLSSIKTPPPPPPPPPTTTPPPTLEPKDPVQDTPIGTIDKTGFWVNVRAYGPEGPFELYVNSSETFGEDCFIPGQQQESKNVVCFVDIPEGVLYTHKLEMQYNIPPGLCENFRLIPAWFWNESSGVGPPLIHLTTKKADDQEDERVESCEVPGFGSCLSHPELTNTSDINGPSCVYDRSELGDGESNCCFGEYTLIKNNESHERSWGSNAKSCIGGAPRVAWEHFDKQGYPMSQLTTINRDDSGDPVGLNAVYELPSNIGTNNDGRFSTLANFYTPTVPAGPGVSEVEVPSPHRHSGYVSTEELDLPYAINPGDDLSGTPYGSSLLRPGRPAHHFTCLDEAFEVKHRIQVYIREWNTLSDFVTYHTSRGKTYQPDVDGREESCGYGDVFHYLPCNDFRDLDDIVKYYGPYNTTGPYNTPTQKAVERRLYFPRVEYEK